MAYFVMILLLNRMNKRQKNSDFESPFFLYPLVLKQKRIHPEKFKKDLTFITITCRGFLQKFSLFVFGSYSKLF